MQEMTELDYIEVVAETGDAWFLRFDNGDEWIPKSQGTLNPEHKTIEISKWMAIERGLV